MGCAPNLHHNKVDCIHLIDKEIRPYVRRQRKNGYRLYCALFLSDVNLGLFRFYSVTQRETLVLALKIHSLIVIG